MIELDIKIKAKDQETVKLFTEMMMKGLTVANQMGEINVTLIAEKDGDKITLIRKEIIIPSGPVVQTPIREFIDKSSLSMRNVGLLSGSFLHTLTPPFKYAEDITKREFLKLQKAGKISWRELEEELIKQKIKY